MPPFSAIYPIPLAEGGEFGSKIACYWVGGYIYGAAPIKNLVPGLWGYPRGEGAGMTAKRGRTKTINFTAFALLNRMTFNLDAGGYLDSWEISFDAGDNYTEMLHRVNNYYHGMQVQLRYADGGDTNNPRQAGSIWSDFEGTYLAAARYAQGSPLLDFMVEESNPKSDSGVSVLVEAAPLDWDPGGDVGGLTGSTDHNGGKFEPVIYPDLPIGYEVIPNLLSLGADLAANVIQVVNRITFPVEAVGLTNVEARVPKIHFDSSLFTDYYIWDGVNGLSAELSTLETSHNSPPESYLEDDILYQMDSSGMVYDVEGTPKTLAGETVLTVNAPAGLIVDDSGTLTIGIYCSQFDTINWRKNTGGSPPSAVSAELYMRKLLSPTSVGLTEVPTFLVVGDTPAAVAASMVLLAQSLL